MVLTPCIYLFIYFSWNLWTEHKCINMEIWNVRRTFRNSGSNKKNIMRALPVRKLGAQKNRATCNNLQCFFPAQSPVKESLYKLKSLGAMSASGNERERPLSAMGPWKLFMSAVSLKGNFYSIFPHSWIWVKVTPLLLVFLGEITAMLLLSTFFPH